jgi:hypothetical protein
MPLDERLKLIRRIEGMRRSHVICYLTSLRPNVQSQIAEDAVRVMFEHLLRLPAAPPQKVKRLDIFLCSNGGSGNVPWRLVALFREFADKVSVLVPYRAYSAATLLALGADEIVMHPFAELGPIDPTVSNQFNPRDAAGSLMGISVEDVSAYVTFLKTTAGIKHEDELVAAIKVLAEKVHPLAIGNVERFIAHSRMIARKILRTHMGESDAQTIDEIVENMASKLYFHGHPINRREAHDDLHLKVAQDVPVELEQTMWALYQDYEAEFKNRETFNPAGDLVSRIGSQPVQPPLAVPVAPGMPPAALAALASAQPLPAALLPITEDYELTVAMIESNGLSSQQTITLRCQLIMVPPAQRLVQQDLIAVRWAEAQVAPVAS